MEDDVSWANEEMKDERRSVLKKVDLLVAMQWSALMGGAGPEVVWIKINTSRSVQQGSVDDSSHFNVLDPFLQPTP